MLDGCLTAAPTSRRGRLAGRRELRRAVLRPGLRPGRHPALRRPPRRPDGGGRCRDAVPAADRLVGVAVHDLDDQLVRPRDTARPGHPARRHVRQSLRGAIAIPDDDRAGLFVAGYVGLQLIRNGFMVLATLITAILSTRHSCASSCGAPGSA